VSIEHRADAVVVSRDLAGTIISALMVEVQAPGLTVRRDR
jgi:hypothetical protein